VLDQSAIPNDPNESLAYIVGTSGSTVSLDVAQVFTPSISGTLSSISVALSQSGPTQPLVVDIRSAPGDDPQTANSPVYGSVMVQASQVPKASGSFTNVSYTSISFSQFDIPVTAGVPLAIVMRCSEVTSDPFNNLWYWGASNQGHQIYSGGITWTRTGGTTGAWNSTAVFSTTVTDQGFEEFVSVPEPSCLIIFAAGFIFGARRPRRRAIICS
jgi:hypothetical protein